MHFQVPVELYRPILEYTSEQRDLCAFCAVSKGFQQESERVLYRDVRLTSDYARLVSWSQAMINNSRLASFVHTLSLPSQTDSGINSRESPLVESMAKAFKALPNLKALYLVNSTSTSISRRFLHPIVLQNCSFRLETFGIRSGYLTLHDLFPFLVEQHNITYWKYERRTLEGLETLSEDPTILPRLSSVYLCDWWILPHLVPRPIRRLRFRQVYLNDDSLPKLTNALGLFKGTLTHLSLDVINLFHDIPLQGPPLVKFLSQIQELLPELRFLHLGGEIISNFHDDDFQTLFDTLSKFHNLETFAIELKPLVPPPDRTIHRRFRSHHSCLELAVLFLSHCTALRRVAFIGDPDWPEGGTVCCVKSPNGQIERSDRDLIKEDSWLTM